MDEMLEALCRNLGVPRRIFEGTPGGTLSEHLYWLERFRQEKFRHRFTEAFVTPLIEEAFPEHFWEVAFVMSPGIRVLKRRKEPTLKVDFSI